jgi:multimeric flavodoxin WrbA
MKIIAVNGSPRKGWNTDTLLKKVLSGAASAGAETEMVYLYDLNFKGCKSCMACKLRKEPRPNRCILRDDLTAVLDRVHEADAVVLGSPIYFSEVTGEMRSFFERFLFQYLNYDDYSKPLSPAKKTAWVFTMNCPETMFDQVGYRELFQRYENWMKLYFGHCETLLATDTMQVKDYSRYHLAGWDGEAKRLRHETVFPEDCRKAFALGIRIATNS